MMENLLIVPKDSSALVFLKTLLKKLNIVKEVKVVEDEKIIIPPSKFKSQKQFLEGFGIFKDHPIDFKEIRKKAWQKK